MSDDIGRKRPIHMIGKDGRKFLWAEYWGYMPKRIAKRNTRKHNRSVDKQQINDKLAA